MLDHEAIAGLTGSKPSGLRGRSSSRAEDTPEHSLDSLMKSVSFYPFKSLYNSLVSDLFFRPIR